MIYFESGVNPFSVTCSLSKQSRHEPSETNDIDNDIDILFLLVLLAQSRSKRET